MHADARQQVRLSKQAIVGGSIKVEQVLQFLVVVGKPLQDTSVVVLRRDEPMGRILADCRVFGLTVHLSVHREAAEPAAGREPHLW